MSDLLEVKGLKTYFFTEDGVVRAVDGISYRVEKNQCVGIVGESGCGKSVGVMSILGLIPSPPGKVVAGEILFEGRDLLKCTEAQMRAIRGNRVSMVFQEPMTSLNPTLTVGAQIVEALRLHRGMGGRAARAEAARLLGDVGISDAARRLNDYPFQLSGGMQQRVMIAMALSCGPSLLIADEPTTALDVTVQEQILDLLAALQRKNGMSVLIITHNLGVVARYVDRLNVMYAGRIIESGDTDQIYQNPKHPYTMALLRAVPRLDAVRQPGGSHISGYPPNLAKEISGCAFAPRCAYAVSGCFAGDMELARVEEEHFSACARANLIVEGEFHGQ